jgi:hypothetical protein
MRALVVYESMYGNTHHVAGSVAAGLRSRGWDVTLASVADGAPPLLEAVDLLVVGGPTHAHTLSSSATRASAATAAGKPDSGLELDDAASGPGLRDWLAALPRATEKAASAFDTRIDLPAMFTGRASRGIARRLRHHGYRLIGEPRSFLVTTKNVLVDGESGRAEDWATHLADQFQSA